MIIGRTNIFAENRSNRNTLTKQKHFYISHLTRDFILKNKIFSLPINLNSIVNFNKWKVIKYSKLKKLNIVEYESVMKTNYGFAELTPNDDYIIFYNDELPRGVQRFTIAHEIGHIILHHFKVPIENREQEANMFAARLLMPMCVLHECKIKSEQEIMNLCDVSYISAHYRYERLVMLEDRNKFYVDYNEEVLKSKFEDFIKEYLKNKI